MTPTLPPLSPVRQRFWTEAEDTLLISLSNARIPHSTIARKLGPHRSRSAVAGRLDRLRDFQTRGELPPRRHGPPPAYPRSITFNLDPEMFHELETFAANSRITRSEAARTILQWGLDSLEEGA